MAELASAAPTSGGLYYWTYRFSSPRWRNLLCWIVGCQFLRILIFARHTLIQPRYEHNRIYIRHSFD